MNLIEKNHRGVYVWWRVFAWEDARSEGVKLGPITFSRYISGLDAVEWFASILGHRLYDTGLWRERRYRAYVDGLWERVDA